MGNGCSCMTSLDVGTVTKKRFSGSLLRHTICCVVIICEFVVD